MSFNKVLVRDGAMFREAQSGDGLIGNYIDPAVVVTAGNLTISVAAIAAGAAVFTGAAAGVAYTTPTVAQIVAAFPKLAVGESVSFYLTNTAAQIATITAGVGFTIAGFTTANAQTRLCVMKLTSPTTITMTCL